MHIIIAPWCMAAGLLFAACSVSAIDDARALIEQKRYAQARERLLIHLQNEPGDTKAKLVLAEAELWLGDGRKGLKTLNDALAADDGRKPEAAKALLEIAKGLLPEKKDGLAFALFEKAVQLSPETKTAAALYLYRAGRQEAAPGKSFERGLSILMLSGKLDPDKAARAGQVCGEALGVLEAENQLHLVDRYVDLCLLPFGGASLANAPLFRKVGLSLYRAGKVQRAVKLLEKAVTLDEKLNQDPAVAFILELGARPDAALADYESYLQRFPDSAYRPDTLAGIADLKLAEGQREEAINILRDIIRKHPEFSRRDEILAKISKLERYALVEDFSRAKLNPALWTEIVASDIPGADHMEIHRTESGVYALAQRKPADRSSGIMSNFTFNAGYHISFEFAILEAAGNWHFGININRPARVPLVQIAGNWDNLPRGAGRGLGQYKVDIDLLGNAATFVVEGPTHSRYRQTQSGIRPPYFFTIAARTGHNGVLKATVDNITVGNRP